MTSRRRFRVLAVGGCLLVASMVYLAVASARSDPAHPAGSEGRVSTAPPASGKARGDDYGAGAAGCKVTKARLTRVPGQRRNRMHGIARGGLFVTFGKKTTIAALKPGEAPGPPGTVFGTIRRDGSIYAKTPWFRGRRAWGRLRVRAIRRPGRDRLLRTTYDNHLGRKSNVVPGAMYFPREGCWHITARSGSAKVKAVVWVVSIDDDDECGVKATAAQDTVGKQRSA